MRFAASLLIAISLLIAPATAAKESHYAQWQSFRRGNETARIRMAAAFLWTNTYENKGDVIGFLCSIGLLLPENRGAAFLDKVADDIGFIVGAEAKVMKIRLLTGSCKKADIEKKMPVQQKALFIDAKGAVLSRNSVWNACIRGLPLTADFMKTNPDIFLHRQGRIRVFRRLTCRDYHRGDLRVWTFPDDPSIKLVLDKRGRMLGDPPAGYVIQKTKKAVTSGMIVPK